ncbi:MAG: hypothetical protein ACHBN1_19385 [Heteroscytonema crispum UTEX LB 1556]
MRSLYPYPSPNARQESKLLCSVSKQRYRHVTFAKCDSTQGRSPTILTMGGNL